METKTSIAFKLFDSGDIKKALSIFKTFKLGLTKEEREAIQITHEVESGRTDFYQSVGVDISKSRSTAMAAINKLR